MNIQFSYFIGEKNALFLQRLSVYRGGGGGGAEAAFKKVQSIDSLQCIH